MRWSKAIPTAAGFYWHRPPSGAAVVCEVLESRGKLYAAFPIGRDYYDWLSLPTDQDLPPESEWAGPIPEPE